MAFRMLSQNWTQVGMYELKNVHHIDKKRDFLLYAVIILRLLMAQWGSLSQGRLSSLNGTSLRVLFLLLSFFIN